MEKLSQESAWNDFYEYKTSLACPKHFALELRRFIDEKAYLPVCGRISRGERFPLPQRSVISKMSTQKKRVVYTYPDAENTVLKLLTHLLLRKYNDIFSPGLYSFRPGISAKDAVRRLTRTHGIEQMWSYKVDISNYFNSVPVDKLLPVLGSVLSDDPDLYTFLSSLLTEPKVLDRGEETEEQKGIMAGTPLSAFYANLYLMDMDSYFESAGAIYARYSDDIILFAKSREEAEENAEKVRGYLASKGLSVNPDKECFASPEDGWTFLGFSFRNGVIDIAPATVKKLKDKMRRKANALQRWKKRNGQSPERAASAFIRVFNRKLLESSYDNELTWSYWFFPVINTADSLHELDLYAQDCIRYLLSGTHTKARFNYRYEDLKALGYRSLVHEYYSIS